MRRRTCSKHVITAQAAYETTPAALREQLHERVGGYVERISGVAEAQLDLLAYHYGRSANLGKKREFLLRAGDRARTDFANAAAIDYYTQLAPLLPGDERVPVQLHLGTVLELTGQWARPSRPTPTLSRWPSRSMINSPDTGSARRWPRWPVSKAGTTRPPRLLDAAEAGFTALGDRAGVGEVLHLAGTLAAQQGAYAVFASGTRPASRSAGRWTTRTAWPRYSAISASSRSTPVILIGPSS